MAKKQKKPMGSDIRVWVTTVQRKKISEFADRENRSISNFILTATKAYIEYLEIKK